MLTISMQMSIFSQCTARADSTAEECAGFLGKVPYQKVPFCFVLLLTGDCIKSKFLPKGSLTRNNGNKTVPERAVCCENNFTF